MKYSYLLLLLLIVAACNKQPQKSAANKYTNTTVQQIHNLKNDRNTKALLPYLKSENALFRREAALAFASVQDEAALQDLILLLRDPSAEVCLQAAYAIGQLGNVEAEGALMAAVEKERLPEVRTTILEAIGKTCTEKGLNFLSAYPAKDSVTEAGIAWGLYRAGLRKILNQEGINLAVNLLAEGKSEQARLGAAHFLARSPRLELTEHFEQIAHVAKNDAAPAVRMAATQALGKVEPEKAYETLINTLTSSKDYRVQVNTIRALQAQPFEKVHNIFSELLFTAHPLTALSIADYFLMKGEKSGAASFFETAKKIENWRVRAVLLAAAMRYGQPELREQVKTYSTKLYNQTENLYEKGLLLKALSEDIKQYDFISQETFRTNQPIIRTYGMEALADMRKQKEFPKDLKVTFAQIFRKAIETGDVAMVGLAAGVIREPALDMKQEFEDIEFLNVAKSKLVLPRDIETYQELQRTINYLTDSEEKPVPTTTAAKPINWNTLKKLPANPKALLKTAKGNITIEFFPNEAPATVANFIDLAQQGSYNNKSFHRVVPNFVAQAGCTRGDGWGSTDFFIRSEFAPLNFKEGYIGMASAGKDTESCQWFITHSPTPHLDGRYTIFARVTEGMDVVHQLNIGDVITAIELLQ